MNAINYVESFLAYRSFMNISDTNSTARLIRRSGSDRLEFLATTTFWERVCLFFSSTVTYYTRTAAENCIGYWSKNNDLVSFGSIPTTAGLINAVSVIPADEINDMSRSMMLSSLKMQLILERGREGYTQIGSDLIPNPSVDPRYLMCG